MPQIKEDVTFQPSSVLTASMVPTLRPGAPLPGRRVERLPFAVRVVTDGDSLKRALQIRQAAYQRHVPDFARTMDQPETYDSDPGGLILLAEAKLSGRPIGTLRLQSNRFRPLSLEQSVDLPDWVSGRLIGATRLGVEAGEPGRMVRLALFKAFYLYCLQEQIDWMVVAARTPLDRIYAGLLFCDVFGEKEFRPLAHAQNIPHRIMAFQPGSAEALWRGARHSLYMFMMMTHHPDIDLSAAPSLEWSGTASTVLGQGGGVVMRTGPAWATR
ncbi:hypothetical protein WT83_30010 [Burkholderia territorii]|uniref:GNAT family N-acetyltransferase n=1 Tax=Burkholderia territorii TaxID=1503055 RepID=A0A108E5M8_9BURK|nr:hypothetical protein [Burkholderia territorii]KWN05143.1 hypothetical protein WT83_30010 [Burkholderia territorii]